MTRGAVFDAETRRRGDAEKKNADGVTAKDVLEKSMKNDNEATNSLSRRRLLGQAVGAAGILSALESTGQVNAQAPPAGGGRGGPRVRDSFDFGWKFFKGDAPGAQQTDFADASWKDVDLPHDFSIEGPFSQDAPARGKAVSCLRASAGTGNISTFPSLTEAER